MTRRLRRETCLLSLLALSTGAVVYLLVRPDSVFAIGVAPVAPAWTASLPTLLHTFGFALLCAACGRDRRQALLLVLAWSGIEMAAELSQLVRPPAIGGLSLQWTFDFADLVAIGAATALALLVLLTHPDTEKQ